MRWLFLLLFILNLFYYVWHQQQAPLRPVEVAPLEQYRLRQQDIHLLSESSAVAVQPSALDKSSAAHSSCMFLGGFDVSGEAEALRQRLAGLDVESVVEGVDDATGVDYWVYLPPLGSRDASLRQLKELQARQIDSFIIAEGDLSNGISLGIFPRLESAESVMTRLVGAGYEPALRELSRDQRSYWVRVDPQHMRLVDGEMLGVLGADFRELRHVVKPCESVAIGR